MLGVPVEMIRRHLAIFVALALLAAARAPGAENRPAADADSVAGLKAEIARLQAENEKLKTENARLREQLVGGSSEGSPGAVTTKPAPRPIAATVTVPATLGAYRYNAPSEWAAHTPKETPLSAMYRSPDKLSVLLVRIHVKGSAPPEMARKYAETVIQPLNQEFKKSKTQVVEPPNVQNDRRFFLKIREKIKVKDKTAQQYHIYRNVNKDMVELTAITTTESDEDASAFLKLAEDLLLSFKEGK